MSSIKLQTNVQPSEGLVLEPRLSHFETRIASLDEKLGQDLNDRLLGMLRASIIPLAEHVSAKLVSSEVRFNILRVYSCDNVLNDADANVVEHKDGIVDSNTFCPLSDEAG